MIDGIDGRLWADHGHDFSEWVAGALAGAWAAFRTLNAIQFEAPWREPAGRRGPGQA